jgi:hypothetical protein
MATDLLDEIARVHSGTIDAGRLVAAFRDAVVVVPTDGGQALLTIDDHGVHWVTVFTGTTELARFARARGDGERSWPYLTTRGARVLDTLLPALDGPAGVAVDIAGRRPVFLPPDFD